MMYIVVVNWFYMWAWIQIHQQTHVAYVLQAAYKLYQPSVKLTLAKQDAVACSTDHSHCFVTITSLALKDALYHEKPPTETVRMAHLRKHAEAIQMWTHRPLPLFRKRSGRVHVFVSLGMCAHLQQIGFPLLMQWQWITSHLLQQLTFVLHRILVQLEPNLHQETTIKVKIVADIRICMHQFRTLNAHYIKIWPVQEAPLPLNVSPRVNSACAYIVIQQNDWYHKLLLVEDINQRLQQISVIVQDLSPKQQGGCLERVSWRQPPQ